MKRRPTRDHRESVLHVPEILEPRLLLARDSANVFALLQGEIEQPALSSQVAFEIAAAEFTTDRGTVVIGFQAYSDDGFAGRPDRASGVGQPVRRR